MESVLDVPSQAEQKYGLKIFYFAWKAFIANLFFPIMTPPLTHPTTQWVSRGVGVHPIITSDYNGGKVGPGIAYAKNQRKSSLLQLKTNIFEAKKVKVPLEKMQYDYKKQKLYTYLHKLM